MDNRIQQIDPHTYAINGAMVRIIPEDGCVTATVYRIEFVLYGFRMSANHVWTSEEVAVEHIAEEYELLICAMEKHLHL